MINNKKSDNYKELFTKEYLMGPNSIKLLEEMLEAWPLKAGSRVMDLGCGRGLTSLFLAKEADVNVFATDLWIDAATNYETFREWGIDGKVVPIHADVHELPYAKKYFDAIISIDSYEYYGNHEGFLEEKILPYLKEGGVVILAIPGLKDELPEQCHADFWEWVEENQDDYDGFRTLQWWKELFSHAKGAEVMKSFELECYDEAWDDWFVSEHEYGLRDKVFFDRGLGDKLSLHGFVIRKTGA